MDLLDIVTNSLKNDFKFVTSSNVVTTGDALKSMINNYIKQFDSYAKFVTTEYSSYRNNISMYMDMIASRIKSGETMSFDYIDEEYCKGVPNCKLSVSKFTGENADKFYKGYKIIMNTQRRYFVDSLDNIKKMGTKDDKFQCAYRGYLFNPKKSLEAIKYTDFNSTAKKIFLTGKSIKKYTFNNVLDFHKTVTSHYIVSEYSDLLDLLDYMKKSFEYMVNRPLLRTGQTTEEKLDYLKVYAYYLMATYNNMFLSAHALFINKLAAREKLLKDAV